MAFKSCLNLNQFNYPYEQIDICQKTKQHGMYRHFPSDIYDPLISFYICSMFPNRKP